VKEYLREVAAGAKSLLAGFTVTLRALVSPVATVQYPREKIAVPAGHRGHPVMLSDAEGRPKCIACGMCMRQCPSQCIAVAGEKKEGDMRKYPTVFVVEYTRCSQCGICADICPVAALGYSKKIGLAGFTREEFALNLLAEFDRPASTS
jgi:NADH-quinone oxidoreductase subunit I